MKGAKSIRQKIYNFIIKGIISIFIAAVIASLIIMYEYKIWIFSKFPAYLISIIIAFLFISLAVELFSLADKIIDRRKFALEGMIKSLIKSTGNKKNLRDIIRSSANILFKSLPVSHICVLLLNNETCFFEEFYSLGNSAGLSKLDINSSLIRWLSQNKKVFVTDGSKPENGKLVSREDFDDFIKKLNIQVILPVYNNGQIVGIICLSEKKSGRLYSAREIIKLQHFNEELNNRASAAIDYEEWNQGQFVSGMLDLSSEILSKAVPVHLPKLAEITFGAFYIPRYREGIDYFDVITPTSTGAGIIATDISGRGINNAIYSVILRSAFHSSIEEAHSPMAVMQKLNKTLHDYTGGVGGIVKAYYCHYNISNMRLTYTNAGFQPLEIYRVEKNIYESLNTEGFPLGTDLVVTYGMGRTNLLVGDVGFLYSRALIESKNPMGEKFGLTQLRGIIKENRRKHPSEITAILKDKLLSFIGSGSPEANILVIVFKV